MNEKQIYSSWIFIIDEYFIIRLSDYIRVFRHIPLLMTLKSKIPFKKKKKCFVILYHKFSALLKIVFNHNHALVTNLEHNLTT